MSIMSHMSQPSDLKAGEFAVSGGALKDPKVTGIRRAAEGSADKGTRFAGPKFLRWDRQLG